MELWKNPPYTFFGIALLQEWYGQSWGVLLILSLFYNQPLKTWITTNLQHNAKDDYQIWGTLYCVAIWWIWKWHNSIVFGRNQDIPQDIGGFIHVRYNEARRGIERHASTHLKPLQPKMREELGVVWRHPPMDWYALNSDGGAKGVPGPAGGGVILRDHYGGFISALSLHFGHCNAFKAEVMALTKGLELARELQIKKLLVQLDNLACVQLLQNRVAGRNECTHMLNHCIQLIQQEDWEIKITHVYCEGNRAPDWLANHGVTQLLPTIFHTSAPAGLSSILEEDFRGGVHPSPSPSLM